MSLVGFGCALLGAIPMYRTQEDHFPRCAQIESVSDARARVWSTISRDGRYARQTDMTLAQCWKVKRKSETCERAD